LLFIFITVLRILEWETNYSRTEINFMFLKNRVVEYENFTPNHSKQNSHFAFCVRFLELYYLCLPNLVSFLFFSLISLIFHALESSVLRFSHSIFAFHSVFFFRWFRSQIVCCAGIVHSSGHIISLIEKSCSQTKWNHWFYRTNFDYTGSGHNRKCYLR